MKKHLYTCCMLLASGVFALLTGCANDGNEAAPNGGAGTGGSMARFAVSNDRLYVVGSRELHVYDIRNAADPKPSQTVELGFGVETIFPYEQNLFIGTQSGMQIFDIRNPDLPAYLSRYDHVQSCDPVVVQGNYAYVTLRDGTDCRFGSNLLDVIDVSNLQQPQVVTSLGMINPHGLGVDGNTLFVCEGEHGLKVFDVSIPSAPQEIQHLPGFHAYDVIPRNKLLLLTGKDGLYQYDYRDPANLVLLSRIPIVSH